MTQYMIDTLIRIASLGPCHNECIIKIYNPKGAYIDELIVNEVHDTGIITGHSKLRDVDTSYDITDGILIDILSHEKPSRFELMELIKTNMPWIAPDMYKYIYYSKGTNHNGTDDVAITEAKSLDTAIENFKKYYSNASKDNVQLINCHKKDYVDNMMIVSNY